MGKMITTGMDVVSFLKEQHAQVGRMFDEVFVSRGSERATAFYALRRMLAVHEAAEEEIVHPVARRRLANGEAIVAARLAEETAAKRVLVELEQLDPEKNGFMSRLIDFQTMILVHARSEEELELAELGAALDQSTLARMTTIARIAESIAPTRPHPGLESAAGNILAGPFVSMLDRARDALTGKS